LATATVSRDRRSDSYLCLRQTAARPLVFQPDSTLFLFNIKAKGPELKATCIAVHNTNLNNSTRLLTKAIYYRVTVAKMFDTTKM